MYGPRAWEKDPARRFGPPGRFPRRRSRSPPPPVGERYPFGEPFPVPPVRPAPGSSPYDRAMRPAEPPFGVRSRPEVYGAYDGRPPYRDINDDGYYNGLRRGVDRAPMDRRAMERSPLRYDKRAAVVERNDFRPPRYMMNDVPDQYPREPRRRDFPSPSRGLGMPVHPRFSRETG
ncbi:unnamed protein product [Dicrocoelium dendriticum]|nr:unnamed protein product [Dicrocoelium dendriticum]